MGRSTCDSPLLPGSSISVGGKEVEVDSVASRDDFFSNLSLTKTADVRPDQKTNAMGMAKPTANLRLKSGLPRQKENINSVLNVAAPKTVATQTPFKGPLLASTVLPKLPNKEPTPRHSITEKDALILRRPKCVPKGKQVVDVVIDPLLTKFLRKHQREGVEFMYECVMGMRDFDGQGAILADEMGLGKSK